MNIPVWTCTPFAVLLLLIAIMPLAAPHFWEKNRNKAIISFALSFPVLVLTLFEAPHLLIHTAGEYISFMLLLASLFVISGGVQVRGDLRGTPAINSAFLLIGAVISNLIGTTGASMLLIRPVLKTNSERRHTFHIPIFFIFIVSNIGGSLTPIGDPPLLLGYLRGVPFEWTFKLFPQWLTAVGILILIFFIWDTFSYAKETPAAILRDIRLQEPLSLSGRRNLILLIAVVLTIFFQVPAPFRELVLLAMTLLSVLLTRKAIRTGNRFTYYPIIEVAILFAGIFITMVPLLDLLHTKGAALGLTRPWQFFWLTGGLSSFLDNAPTYVALFSMAQSVTDSANLPGAVIAGVREDLLLAISCGAVFMGANTYIGNGPNFMVKSIAEEQGFKVPHFFEYMFFSAIILVPLFILLTFIFFA